MYFSQSLKYYDVTFLSITTSQVLEKAESYEEAFEMLKSTKITAPVYYIVGGSKPGQGAVVVRDPEEVAGVVQMRGEKAHPLVALIL